MKGVLAIVGVVLLSACSSAPSSAPAATTSAPAKIPVTTKSPEALAHYQNGLTFFENAHTAEGVEALKQALALDPDFATAKALKAIVTSGDEGLKEADAALAAAASRPRCSASPRSPPATTSASCCSVSSGSANRNTRRRSSS